MKKRLKIISLLLLLGASTLMAQDECDLQINASSTVLNADNPAITLEAVLPNFTGDTNDLDFFWFTPEDTREGSTITVTTPGSYAVSISGACINFAEIEITEGEEPTDCGEIEASFPNLTCDVSNIILDASNAFGVFGGEPSYQWSTGAPGTMIEVDAPGTYWIVATGDSLTCFDTLFIDIGQDLNPPQARIDAFPDIILNCASPTILSSGASEPEFSFSSAWSTGIEGDSIISITEAGTYSVTITSFENGCKDTAFIEIANALGFESVVSERCVGDDFEVDFVNQLGGQTGFTIFPWEGPDGFTSTDTNLVISNLSQADAGLYTRRIIQPGNTCEDTIRITLPIGAPGAEVNIISNAPLCEGDDLELSGTGEGVINWAWITPDAEPIFAATPDLIRTTAETQVGTFILVGFVDEDVDICPGLDTLEVTISGNPTVEIASNAPICEEEDLDLMGIGDSIATWSWTTPGGQTFDMQDVFILGADVQSGLYILTGANEAGCTDSDSLDVMVLAGQSIETNFLVGFEACAGDTFQFIDYSRINPDQLAGVSFLWNFGNGDTSADRDPKYAFPTPGAYEVTLEVTSGACQNVSVGKTVDIISCFRQGEADGRIAASLYPTVNNGYFDLVVDLEEESKLSYEIFSQSGQLIQSEDFGRVGGLRKSIQVEQKGMYFIKISHDYGVSTLKTIIIN